MGVRGDLRMVGSIVVSEYTPFPPKVGIGIVHLDGIA
jgi:hypothetical protein